MPLDGITMRCLVRELSEKLMGGRVERVSQAEKDEITLHIRTASGLHMLLISADSSTPRVHLTAYKKPNPQTAPMFCMLLRKHLSGGRVVSIEQTGLDRVLTITFECRNELGDLTKKHLISEIMGRHSNIVLIDDEGQIIDSIKRVDITISRLRTILPGLRYSPPPPQNKKNPLSSTEADFESALLGHPNPDKALLSEFEGLSPLAAREICARAQNEKDIPRAAAAFFAEPFAPSIVYDIESGAPVDFAAYRITQYGARAKVEEFESISAAMDIFLTKRDNAERMRQQASGLVRQITTHLERCRKKLSLLQDTLKEAEDRERFRLYGDLITANLYRLKPGMDQAEVENYYDEGRPVTIPLDKSLSPAKNAQRYYARYAKAKTAEKMAAEQMGLTLSEIEYLESVLHAAQSSKTIEELFEVRRELMEQGYIKQQKAPRKGPTKKKEDKINPPSFNIGGFTVLAGKNNRQNDYITLKLARATDIWLHVKDYPGSHVLIKSEGKEVPPDVIFRAAQIAAGLSRAKNSSSVAVDYTFAKNVRKTPGAKPGMVIYDHHKTIFCAPAPEGDI